MYSIQNMQKFYLHQGGRERGGNGRFVLFKCSEDSNFTSGREESDYSIQIMQISF